MKILNEKTINYLLCHSKPDKCGYLLKKSGDTKKSFQRRYFVLIANLLIYFDKLPSDFVNAEPIGVIVLEKYIVEIFDDQKQEFAFQIKLGGLDDDREGSKNYILASESEGDLKDWIQALVTAGSDYFPIKEEELSNEVKAIREVLACQSQKDRMTKIFNRQYNPFGGPVNESIPYNLVNLFSMTFEEMHETVKSNYLNT